jgi:hypothetical protein
MLGHDAAIQARPVICHQREGGIEFDGPVSLILSRDLKIDRRRALPGSVHHWLFVCCHEMPRTPATLKRCVVFRFENAKPKLRLSYIEVSSPSWDKNAH